jgi:hypothetical protein
MTWFVLKFALWYAVILAMLLWFLSPNGPRKKMPRESWILGLMTVPLLLLSVTAIMIASWPP